MNSERHPGGYPGDHWLRALLWGALHLRHIAGYLARLGPGAPGDRVPTTKGYRARSKRREVKSVAEQRPTNERLADLLQEVVREVHELKDGQNQLAADVRKLTESSRS